MGVRGLTTFIAKSSNKYLRPFELKNSLLVIDGNCIASQLFKWYTKRDSAFGGDYDEYFALVKQFFTLLLKCNITPIVIFDGGYEEKKLKTVLYRLKTKLMTLKTSFANGFSTTKFFPLFMKQVFWDVLHLMNIFVVQTEFEADGEIAALGRQFNCPVLSYDSDFFIYDVLYIPFDSLQHEAFLVNDAVDNEYAMKCLIYDVTDFLKLYPGLQKCHLPLLAVMLGNDFVDSNVFAKFFNQISMSKSKQMSTTERKIHGLLHWLKHESESSSTQKIVNHLSKKDHDKVLACFKESKSNYASCCKLQLEILHPKITLVYQECSLKIKDYIWKLFSSCKLPPSIVDMITFRTYFLPLPIEDVKLPSTHNYSLPIIAAIYSIACAESNEPLTIHLRLSRSIKIQMVEAISTNTNLEENNFTENKMFLETILSLDPVDTACIASLPDEHKLFFSCFICWIKTGLPNVYHVHALLLSYLSNQAKGHTGMCKIGKLNSLTSNDVSVFNKIFLSFRKTSESARLSYSVTAVHVFNVFQSVLYHATILNTLLWTPFQVSRVHVSLCGTLFYNIFANLNDCVDIDKYLKLLLCPAPEISKIYFDLCNQFERYFPPMPEEVKVEKKRRKRKSKKKVIEELEIISQESDAADSSEYEDMNNKFNILQVQ